MMTILILLGVCCVSAIGILIFQVSQAPEGREDSEGFHFAAKSPLRRPVRKVYENDADHEAAGHGTTHHVPAT